jgi:hypothetical protein
MLTIEKNDDAGCFMLIDDGIGLAQSKSRNVLVRIRDALNAVRETSLVGLTVENTDGTIPNRGGVRPRGVVLALDSPGDFVVRLPDGKLDEWSVKNCRVVEPDPPTRDTPWNSPVIGVRPAIELLKRWLALQRDDRREAELVQATETFLEAREAAEHLDSAPDRV